MGQFSWRKNVLELQGFLMWRKVIVKPLFCQGILENKWRQKGCPHNHEEWDFHSFGK